MRLYKREMTKRLEAKVPRFAFVTIFSISGRSSFAFASVVAIKDIKKGDVFTRDNLWVKRPGVGEFKAESFESLLGLCAANDIGADSLLRKLDIVGEVK